VTKPAMEDDWNGCLQTLEGHSDWVWSVAFSPDGQRLASASADRTVKTWDPQTGVCQQTLEGHSHWVWSVAFSPDGQRLASASRDGTVKIWDPQTGVCQQTLEGHSDSVNSVAFSPDGQRLASASRDNTVKIWDPQTGVCQQTFKCGYTTHLQLDPSSSSVHTDRGVFTLSPTDSQHASRSTLDLEPSLPSPPSSERVGYGLEPDNSWITYDGKKLLWLPSEFRPGRSAVSGSTVAIGCRSGRVLVFGFVDKPCWTL
jgi:WD40 repeat protein